MHRGLPLLLLVINFVFCGQILYGQQGHALVPAIQDLEKKHGVLFSYSGSLLEGIRISNRYDGAPLDSVIARWSKESAFDFIRKSDDNILVKPKSADHNLKICVNAVDSVTGLPLIGATLAIKGTTTGSTLDINGNTSFYTTLKPDVTIVLRSIGFESKEFSLETFNGAGCLNVLVSPSEVQLKEVKVQGYLTQGINYHTSDHSMRISTNNAGLLPGETETDILTSIEALPGVNSPDGKAGNLVMRGDDPDKVLLSMDDIPIYHKGHYFGTISPYNTNVLDEVVVQRSGFGAETGGRVGGAVRLFTQSGIPDSAEYMAGLASSYFSTYAHVPVVKKKFSLMGGFRSSYPNNFESPRILAINDFIYQQNELEEPEVNSDVAINIDYRFRDANAKAIYDLNDKHKLSLSWINLDNQLRSIRENSVINEYKEDTVSVSNQGINLKWNANFSSRYSANTSLVVSSYDQVFSGISQQGNQPLADELSINEVNDYSFRHTSILRSGKLNQLRFGFQLTQQFVKDVSEALDTATNRITIQETDTKEMTSAGHVSYTSFIGKKLNLTPGLRVSHYSGTSEMYIEPRLIANYYASESLTLKLNAGRYFQFINQIYGANSSTIAGLENLFWQLSNTNDIPVVGSKQISSGILWNRKGWTVDLEGYYKLTEDISVANLGPDSLGPFMQGDYESFGADLMVRRAWKRLDVWASYTVSRTNAFFPTISQSSFRSIWDQAHLLNIVGTWRSGAFSVSAGWKFKSGLAALHGVRKAWFDGIPTNNTNGINVEDLGPSVIGQYVSEYPDHHQLDLSAAWRFKPGKKNKINGQLGVALYNVYNRRILLEQFVRVSQNQAATETLAEVYGLGFAPSIMLQIRW